MPNETTTVYRRQREPIAGTHRLLGGRSAWPVALSFVLTDAAAFLAAFGLACVLRTAAGGEIGRRMIFAIPVATVLFVLISWALRLYPGVCLSSIVELHHVVKGTTITFLVLLTASFFERTDVSYSRAAILMALVFCMVFTLIGRAMTRSLLSRFHWWGVRAVIVGTGEKGRTLAGILETEPKHGLRVVSFIGCVDRDRSSVPAPSGNGDHSITHRAIEEEAHRTGAPYALLSLADIPPSHRPSIIDMCSRVFVNTLIIPDLVGLSSYGVQARDFGGVLGLEIHHRLLLRGPQVAKRIGDVALAAALLLCLAPVFLLIAVAIKLTSTGPVFYGHRRVGRGGSPFHAWKFRTMVANADQVLKSFFEQHPELELEWTVNQKLRNDPRVTRIGKVLRRASLDELPQLWNVLCKQMSLVGPRPITQEEISRYGKRYDLYRRVVPGLTGLWQVSGRNNTTYAERVQYDEFYVRNWSVWMDLDILCRTVKTVLTGYGAH